MAIYSLIEVSSNQVVNVIDWDPTSSYSPPDGYTLELYTTESYFFSQQEDTSTEYINTLAGEFIGNFTGELTGSISINGKSFDDLLKETDFGSFYYLSGSELPKSASFVTDNETNTSNIKLSVTNYDGDKQKNYLNKFNHILNNDITNYVITLTNRLGLGKRSYLVKNTTNNNSHYSLDVELLYTDYDESKAELDHFYNSRWYLDIQTPDEPQSGKFYGDFNGTIGGEKLEDILSIPPKCSALEYETETFTLIPTPNISNIPKLGSFRFDKDASNDWNNVSPTMVRIHSNSAISNIYKNLLARFISEGLEGSTIKFSYYNPLGITVEKTFLMLDGYYVERDAQSNVIKFYRQDWSTSTKYEINDTSNEFDINLYPPTSINDGYYNIRIQQVETEASVNPFPINELSLFDICITLASVRKRIEVFEFKSTVTPWTVPAWADKITIYSIGAGGGGGGGSAGWGHDFPNVPYAFSTSTPNVPTLLEAIRNDSIGFQFVTGGGGGGGGNIAISELFIDKNNIINSTTIGTTLLPPNSLLNIYVGKGGFGGVGLTNSDQDYQFVSINDIIDFVKYGGTNQFSKWQSMIYASTIRFDPDFDAQKTSLPSQYNYAIETFYSAMQNLEYETDQYELSELKLRMQVANTKAMGKNGGYSSVELDASSNTLTNTTIVLAKASGGIGGMNGIAFQNIAETAHRFCGVDSHFLNDPIAFGGGATLENSVGNKKVIPGGNGGYGISMPNIRQNSSSQIFYNNELISFKFGNHVATSIPFKLRSKFIDFTLPHGSTYKLGVGETWENDGYKAYNFGSNISHTELAPLGGNGGMGANIDTLENRSSNLVIANAPERLKSSYGVAYWTTGLPPSEKQLGMPTNWFSRLEFKTSSLISLYFTGPFVGSAFKELRPFYESISTNLISKNVTHVNGVLKNYYEFSLKNEGSLGGIDIYRNTNGTVKNLSSLPNTLTSIPSFPENGLDYGQGGGGGCAAYTTNWSDRNVPISGQNGGNGADGIVIIIAEQL